MSDAEADIDYQAVSYVIKSKPRVSVMLELTDGMSTPSKIAEKTGIDIAHVSRALQQMRKEDMVDLIVAEDTKKGRLYELTEEGEDIAPAVREVADR